MQPIPVSINVDLGAMLGVLQNAAQRASDFVRFGTGAADNPPQDLLEPPSEGIHFYPASNAKLPLPELADQFRTWIIASALRDCVEAVQLYLEEVRRVCAVFSFGSPVTVPADEWKQRVFGQNDNFHQRGLPAKIDYLRKEFPGLCVPASEHYVRGINRARNCLVHRQGVVSSLDVDSSGQFEVSWLRIQLFVQGAEGERVISLPYISPGGEQLFMRSVEASRTFRVGERIVFSYEEFAAIVWTLFLFGSDLRAAVDAYGRAMSTGTPVESHDSSAPPA